MIIDADFPEFNTDFKTKVKVLRSKKMLSFDQINDCITTIKAKINTVVAAKECGLTDKPELKTLACAFSDDEFCEAVIGLLERELPVLDTEMYLEEGQYYLMAESIGMNAWREEEVEELIYSPEGYGKDFSLIAFLMLINYGIDENEPWDKCTEYFGWPINSHYLIAYNGNFNRSNLKKALKSKGAPPELNTMLMLTFFPPEDNVFLCVTADDWECDPDCMNFEINTENVHFLRKKWKQANPLLDQIEPARKWIVENPWFIPILGETLENCRELNEN